MLIMMRLIIRFFLIFLGILTTSFPIYAEIEPEQYFKQNCISCHTIGAGKRVGPDLKDVTQRKDKEWLINFIIDPAQVLASGDSYAIQLFNNSNNVIMTKIPGLTPAAASILIDYIHKQSGLGPIGLTIPAVLTQDDIASGGNIYLGYQTLKNRGPACINCHQIAGLEPPGGGVLGPDLTNVFSRLGGVQGLSGWLSSPVTPIMQLIFQNKLLEPNEITALTAYFQEISTNHGSNTQAATIANTLTFLLLGIISVFVLLGLLDWIWRKRFTAVREYLVKKNNDKEPLSEA